MHGQRYTDTPTHIRSGEWRLDSPTRIELGRIDLKGEGSGVGKR